MRPTLVVLGGASAAVPTHVRARERGYRLICVDNHPAASAAPYADEVVAVPAGDPRRVAAALAGRRDVVGVLAPANDLALPTLSHLARRWNLPDPLPDPVVRASVDKEYFRALCDRLGFPGPRYATGRTPQEVAGAAASLRHPVVVKPADAQSGLGIGLCLSPGALGGLAAAAFPHSPSGKVIAEERLTGAHHTAEVVVDAGQAAFLALTTRTLDPPYFVTTSHLLAPRPTGPTAGVTEQVACLVETLCAALGYRRGLLDLDLVVGEDRRVYPVEMGARSGGNGLDRLVHHALGVDLVDASIDAAVGAPFDLAPVATPRTALVRLLYADRIGVLASVGGTERVRAMPEVAELAVLAEPGQMVLPTTHAGTPLAMAVLVGDDPAGLHAAARQVATTLTVTTE